MDQVKLGWGRREISMEGPISIPGQMYMRISEGIMDPLYATALVVDGGQGQDHVIFCSCDVVLLTEGVIEMTRDLVAAQRPEINRDFILMNATHTHSGCNLRDTPEKTPDGKPIYPGREYRKFFSQRCAEAIIEAWDNRRAGGIGYGYGYAVVAHSRRVVYFNDRGLLNPTSMAPNGHAIMYGKTNDPDFSHYEGGADHFLNLMFTFDSNDQLTGIVVNVPCPSQVTEQLVRLSADYWHDVREMVKKEFGEHVYVLPQCAAAGDLAPRALHYMKAQERRMRLKYNMGYDLDQIAHNNVHDMNKRMSERYDIAERITQGIVEVYAWAKKDIQTHLPVSHVKKIVPHTRRRITDEELAWCQQNLENMKNKIPDPNTCEPMRYRKAFSNYNSVKKRNETILRRYTRQDQFPVEDIQVHILRIGDIAFATNKFELYHDFMHRVQARSPFLQTFVIQLAGHETGTYLATKRAEANKGYSASLFCNWISHEGGQDWVESVLEALNELHEKG